MLCYLPLIYQDFTVIPFTKFLPKFPPNFYQNFLRTFYEDFLKSRTESNRIIFNRIMDQENPAKIHNIRPSEFGQILAREGVCSHGIKQRQDLFFQKFLKP